jgi:hypothetical protein
MIHAMELTEREIYTLGTHYKPSQTMTRSLGRAIFLVAIADYRGTDEQEHTSAKRFLYPQTREWREHHNWAVESAEGMNPAWLREALDRCKSKWDRERARRIAKETKSALKSDWRNGPDEQQRGERIHSDGPLVPTERRRSAHPSFQPAGEACSARAGDVAAGL